MSLKNVISSILRVLFFIFLLFFFKMADAGVDSLKAVVCNKYNFEHPDKRIIKAAIVLTDYYSRVSFDTAKRYAAIARRLAAKLGNKKGIAMAYNITAMPYSETGYYDSAVPYLDSALKIFKSIADTTGIIFVRNNLAVVQMRLGNYSEALANYQQNLTFAERKDDYENMLLAYNNMGISYFDWKKYNQALESYQHALLILDKKGEEERKGSVYNNIGEVYRKLGNSEEAQKYFEKSYQINTKYGKQHSILISISNMGDVYFDKKEYRKALENYKKALKISKKIPDGLNVSLMSIKIGQTLNTLGYFNKAENYLLKGLQMAQKLQVKNNLLEAYKGLIENARLKKKSEALYIWSQKYMTLNASLFNDKSMKAVNELETKFKTAQKEREIAILTADKKAKELELQVQRNQKYFLAIAILFILFVVYLLFNRYRMKELKEKATLEKAKISIEQRLLRSQMNPHFIFNSLNSINSFIGTNNIKEAQLYLTKFARLMRLILENSRKASIALEDEIQALQLNLDLEKLRFENRFDFEIQLAGNISAKDTYISPMLIQPFIENSIKHGFKNKKDKGWIRISFQKNGQLLVCVVQDNGVGCEQSEKLKNKKGIVHNSLGTQVTNERFSALKDKDENAGFEIIDLKDEAGNVAGTKVIIKIPYEEE